jgi:hypothetical protein
MLVSYNRNDWALILFRKNASIYKIGIFVFDYAN